jgi:TRAP-type transport system periplasmic protein
MAPCKKLGGWRGWITAVAGMACLLLALSSAPAAAQTFNWKLNNNFAETRNETKLLHGYAEDINKRSNGQIKVTVYDGGSLSLKDADIFRWLPTGAAEIGVLNASFVGRDAPELNAIYIQGSIGGLKDHLAALPELEKIQGEIVKKWGIVPVGYMAFPVWGTSVFTRDDPVNTLEQLKKKKIRVWSKGLVMTFNRLGVAAQIVPQNELYVALKTGVVDSSAYPARLASSISLQEVTKYGAYFFPTAAIPYVIVVPEKTWNALPENLKKVLSEATDALYAQSKSFEGEEEAEANARKFLTDKGVKWLPDFPAADLQAFVAAASKTWEEMAREAGGKTLEYRTRILKAMGRAQ